MNDKISFDLIVKYLGEPVKTSNGHSYWQCPICQDSGRDNLIYTHSKELLTCFADTSHSHEIYSHILKENSELDFKQMVKKPEHKIIKIQEEFKPPLEWFEYQHNCNIELINDDKALAYLQKKRGIRPDTVKSCGIGIDKKNRRWVFPVYDLKTLAGFEYRTPELTQGKGKKVFKEKGTKNTLAQINPFMLETEILLFLEGFIDSYAFYQRLKDNEQQNYYHVMTPTHGVGSFINLITKFHFGRYKKVILFLDSDEHGIEVMNEAKKLYPFMEIMTLNCGCKDFGEHYMRCLNYERLKAS